MTIGIGLIVGAFALLALVFGLLLNPPREERDAVEDFARDNWDKGL